MAPHSSTLAWKFPWTEEPGGLQSMGSRRVGHDRATSLWLFTFVHWRRKWQPTPVFLPGESQGWGNLVGCHLWGRTESDTTEVTAAAAAKQISPRHAEAKSSVGLHSSHVYSAFVPRLIVLTHLSRWKSAGFQHHFKVYSPWKGSDKNEAASIWFSGFLFF